MEHDPLHHFNERIPRLEGLYGLRCILLQGQEVISGPVDHTSAGELLSRFSEAFPLEGFDPMRVLPGHDQSGTTLFCPLRIGAGEQLLIITGVDTDPERNTLQAAASGVSLLLDTVQNSPCDCRDGLADESSQFRMMMKLWKGARWIYDVRTEENQVDENWKALYGVPEAVDLDDFHDYFEEHITSEVSAMLYRTMHDYLSGRIDSYHVVFPFDSEEKGLIWLEGFALAAAYDEDGQPTKIIGLNRDITDAHLKKVELEHTNNLLKTILANMPSGVFWKDTESVYQGANDVFAHDTGVASYRDVIGKTDRELPYVTAEYEYYRAQDQRIMESRVPVIHEVNQLFDAEGLRGWSYTSKVPLINSNDEVFGILGVYTDISELKRIEQQLRENEGRIQAILDSSSDIIWTIDSQFVTEFISPSAERLLGYSAGELASLPVRTLMTEESRQVVLETFDELEESAGRRDHGRRMLSRQVEITAVRKDGTTIPIDLVITPLEEEGEGLFGYLVIGRDMTDRKRLEEQLRHTQRIESVSRLAGGVAHDFNNLLQVILGYSELVLDSLEGEPADQAMMRSIIDAGNKAKSLVEQLLRFSRNNELELRRLNLQELIMQLMPSIYPLFHDGVELKLFETEAIPDILADPQQLEHLLLNICMNANDAMSAGGEFAIATSELILEGRMPVYGKMMPPGQYVCLTMGDTGIGMSREQVATLFDPFFSTKDAAAGAGLGLSIIYGIVNEHNGFIDVSSEESAGTEIRIYFPVLQD